MENALFVIVNLDSEKCSETKWKEVSFFMYDYTKEDSLRLVEEEDVAFIRLQFTDIFGAMKNMAVTVSQLEKTLDNRCMFDVSSLEGLSGEKDSDMYLYPDLNTFEIFPWRPQQGKVARMICDVYRPVSYTHLLHTKNTTYQMQVDRYGFLLHLYYGKRADGCMDYLLTFYDRGFSGNPYDAGRDKTYSMDALPQEFPSLGTGDYRTPACIIKNTDRTYSSDFRYVRHSLRAGKYSLKGLPAVYALSLIHL